jgi:carbon storage regulator
MLILARKINESIMIGDQIEISVVDIKGDQVKLGISAPQQVKVFRREVYRMIQEENRQAALAKPGTLPKIEGLPAGGRRAPGAADRKAPDAGAAGGEPPGSVPPKDPKGT